MRLKSRKSKEPVQSEKRFTVSYKTAQSSCSINIPAESIRDAEHKVQKRYPHATSVKAKLQR